jgi:WD40 repeat protein
MATSSEDGTVKIWDLRSPNVQRDYTHGSAVNDVVIHPNQGEVISCDQAGCVKIWDLGENANTHTLIPEEDVPTRSVTVANDGSMLVAGNNKVMISIVLAAFFILSSLFLEIPQPTYLYPSRDDDFLSFLRDRHIRCPPTPLFSIVSRPILTSGQRLRLENVQQQRHNNNNPNHKIHRPQQISNPLSPLLGRKTSRDLLSRYHRQDLVYR